MRIDPSIELTAETYYWTAGESTWHSVSRDELAEILQVEAPPAFRTILGKTGDLYSGPFYADFDGDLDEVCHKVREFLDNLEAADVDLESVRIFASGGRGFHIEVPAAVFGGCDHMDLPKIYKALALALYVDTLDTRIYSERKGRQWRVPNVKRSNGLYKVPLTVAEARSLTPERYADLCSAPRPFPHLKAPVLAPKLAVMFRTARDKVELDAKRPKTFSAAEAEIRRRFEGSAPPSVQALLQGEFLPDAGWNQTAIQLALLAHVLGWSDDRLIHEARGLIAAHKSDGSRYNSPAKRERELVQKFHYCEANPDYTFSVGGLCSILPAGVKPDLQGLEADPDDEAPDYVELLDAVEGPRDVVTIARQIQRDESLSETETQVLLKRCARAAGVGVKALKADLYDPGTGLVISVSASDFSGSVDSAMRALSHIPTLRQRCGKLVELRGGRIWPVDLPKLGYLLSSVARWRTGEGNTRPDVQILNAVLTFGEWHGLPELVGVATQPTLLPDGSIGIPEGYEGSFLPVAFPAFEGTPAEAMTELRSLLTEFSFNSEADRAVALCAILTAVSRPNYKAAPAFIVTANEAGTGKGYLCELVSLFACPEVEPIPWPSRREERMKTLHAALLDGRQVLFLDNLKTGSGLDDEVLCTAISEGKVSGRVLGSSTMQNASARVLVVGNGNNVAPQGDMIRRSLVCELVSPGGTVRRVFKDDPVERVRRERGRWVGVALCALQGVRAEVGPFASFGPWSSAVLSVVVGAGLPDPVGRVAAAVEDDDERIVLGLLLHAWHGKFGLEPVTVKDIWTTVRGTSDPLRHLLGELAGRGEDIDGYALGCWLRSNAGRVVEGLKLLKVGTSYKGTTWAVVPAHR